MSAASGRDGHLMVDNHFSGLSHRRDGELLRRNTMGAGPFRFRHAARLPSLSKAAMEVMDVSLMNIFELVCSLGLWPRVSGV